MATKLSGCMVGLLLACAPHAFAADDVPLFSTPGSHAVGYRTVVAHPKGAEPLKISLWYPATLAAGASPGISYSLVYHAANGSNLPPFVTRGRAVADAPPERLGAPAPLVVFSPGYEARPEAYAAVAEHYASYGFIVIAPAHHEDFDPQFEKIWSASIDRPRDLHDTLDFAATLGATGDFQGAIDMTRVAVVGHSYGGYAALAVGGATYDLDAFNARCVKQRDRDPYAASLCAPLVPYETRLAARAGVDPKRKGLWPPVFTDARVQAIITMAGDSYLFDAKGHALVTVPMMAMGGTGDDSTPYDWGVAPSYREVSSARKSLVSFKDAGHSIFMTPCDTSPAMLRHPSATFLCGDRGGWDRRRAMNLVLHFSTAFLLDTLQADRRAHAALLPGAATTFAGVKYETTLR